MAATSIEWTDRTINPIRARPRSADPPRGSGHYCEKVSPGCAHCYSSAMQHRFGTPRFGSGQRREQVDVFLDPAKLAEVLRRRQPTRWFWCDMTDLFGDWVPDEWIDACFATMALTPQHTHQVLTKRPERMRRYFCESVNGSGDPRAAAIEYAGYALGIDRPLGWLDDDKPLPNVWLGVSVEDQQRADERIPLLLRTPAAVRFLSCEPLLGPIRFRDVPGLNKLPGVHIAEGRSPAGVDWVIAGGESGPGARPCQLAWLRSLVAQCRAAGVACFVKQLGAVPVIEPVPATLRGPAVLQAELAICARWPDGTRFGGWSGLPALNGRVAHLRDRKGGDMSEWPADLRVREFPSAAVAR
jgi:protein gp37